MSYLFKLYPIAFNNAHFSAFVYHQFQATPQLIGRAGYD